MGILLLVFSQLSTMKYQVLNRAWYKLLHQGDWYLLSEEQSCYTKPYLNQGSLGETPFHAISNSLRDIPQWEELRVKLAGRVRQQMLDENSAKCKECHKTDSEWFNGIERHKIMLKEGKKTCIECHYNLVHEDVDWHESMEKNNKK